MNNGTRERRARCLLGVVLAMFGVLVFRLYSLQIGDWERYRIQSEKNTMQPVPLEASRGLVRDRNGTILVDNRPSYTLSVIPSRFLQGREGPERADLIDRLGRLADMPEEVLQERLAKRTRHFYDAVKLRRDVRFETVSIVEEARYDLTGVEIQVEARRGYPTIGGGPVAPHILGYVGLIDPDEYPRMAAVGYAFDDQVGKRGIERLCEAQLRGTDGLKYIEVNAFGREVGSFPEKLQPAIPGRDVILTIDARLQRTAESAFGDSLRGSLIAIQPETGEILAIVSKPDFDPGAIRNQQAWDRLRTDRDNPLLNRALQGEYAPASTFKMITGLAALDMGIIRPGEIRYPPCEGQIEFGDRVFRCHNEAGDGPLDLEQALARSCDVFFYYMGLEVGIANWSRYARLFGFGRPTGLDIAGGGDGEAAGLLPNRAYYERRKGKWFDGNMLNLAIGQGELLVTPAQVARYTAALATGRLATPRLLRNGPPPSEPAAIQVSDESLAEIRRMMRTVVEGVHGTGKRAQIDGLAVAGKTGTAQNPHGEDHAWFVSFAPVEDPMIAVAVIVENGGSGGLAAAPMAREVMETWLKLLEEDTVGDIRVAARVIAGERAGPVPQAADAQLTANVQATR